MSYESLENSTEEGRPVSLYRFMLGSSIWQYTSAHEDVTVEFYDADLDETQTYVYKPTQIKDSGIRMSGEAASDSLNIEASSTIGPAQLFMGVPPSQSIWVQIWRKHEGADDFLVSYQGEISQVNFPMPGKAIISCQTLGATLQREGLRIPWSRSCPYAVYDPDTCKKDKYEEQVPILVLGVTPNEIICAEAATFDDGYFNGGMLEWDDPFRGHEVRLVELHVGNVLTIFNTAEGAYVGMVAHLYRGCRQTVESCQELNNYDNYGGIPHLPGRSPFDGNPVF